MECIITSEFFDIVSKRYGTFLGREIASSAEDSLRQWGIDPKSLRALPGNSNNSRIFSLDDVVAIKVVTELEQQFAGEIPEAAGRYTAQRLRYANIGFDAGSVPVSLMLFPFLKTKGVKPIHVKALCHELHTKAGTIFRDNKPDNVGLTEEGVPYVIDTGALASARNSGTQDSPFLYPGNSGLLNQDPLEWEATDHEFTWPDSAKMTPEFKKAEALLQKLQTTPLSLTK